VVPVQCPHWGQVARVLPLGMRGPEVVALVSNSRRTRRRGEARGSCGACGTWLPPEATFEPGHQAPAAEPYQGRCERGPVRDALSLRLRGRASEAARGVGPSLRQRFCSWLASLKNPEQPSTGGPVATSRANDSWMRQR